MNNNIYCFEFDKLQYKQKLKHLIEECDCWSDDETEYIVEN
jgi:hypothetical protein